MATRKFKVEGWNHDASTTAIVTMGGVQVFSGAISTAVVSPYDGVTDPAAGEIHYILSWDYTNADDTAEQEVACSIEITAGSASIGTVKVSSGDTNSASYPAGNEPAEEIDSNWYYVGLNDTPYGDGSSTAIPEKKNILIDGSSPTLLTADADLGVNEPSGGISAPTFSGWQFALESGQTISYTQRIPALVAAYIA